MRRECADFINLAVQKFLEYRNFELTKNDIQVTKYGPGVVGRAQTTIPVYHDVPILGHGRSLTSPDLTIWKYKNITYGRTYVETRGGSSLYIYITKKGDIAKMRLANYREQEVSPFPVMSPEMKDDILNDTIRFLKVMRNNTFNLKPVRGILLHGSPGNGKSSLCKYLMTYAEAKNIMFNQISAADISFAWSNGKLKKLMNPVLGGFLFCDDIDISLLSRRLDGAKACDLLSAMQGVDNADCPLVRIFTTNEKIKDLDEAFMRPGRIDKCLEFPDPDESMRANYLDTWPDEIRNEIDCNEIVKMTEGWSFAEIEEIKQRVGIAVMMDENIPKDFSNIPRGQDIKRVGF